MTKHETFQDYGMLGLLWLASLGVIYVLPNTPVELRYDLGYAATVAWFIILIIYARWEKIAPHSPVILAHIMKFVNYFWIGYLLFTGGFTVAVATLTWSVFTVNGVGVITYGNILNVLLDIFGIILILLGINLYVRYSKSRKRQLIEHEFADTSISIGKMVCPQCGSPDVALTWALLNPEGYQLPQDDGTYAQDWTCSNCNTTTTLRFEAVSVKSDHMQLKPKRRF